MKGLLVFLLSLCTILCASGCGSKNAEIQETTVTTVVVAEDVSNSDTETVETETTYSETKVETNDASVIEVSTLSELDSELDLVEIESVFLQDELLDSELTLDEQNKIYNELYKLWDDELNSLWSRFWDEADRSLKDSELENQRSWIADKESKANTTASKYEDKSEAKQIKIKAQAKLTRLRCYEIASLLGKLTNQTVTTPFTDYEGLYIDTEGTNEVYSDLTIVKAEDDFYDVEIGLYRLTTLSGYATLENGILQFVDESMNANIKGDILIDNDSATFTITSSDWEYLSPEDYFTFDEKWDN